LEKRSQKEKKRKEIKNVGLSPKCKPEKWELAIYLQKPVAL
jgi:hypothetical protein